MKSLVEMIENAESKTMDAGCLAGLSRSCAAVLSDYGRLGGISDLFTTVSDYRGSDCG